MFDMPPYETLLTERVGEHILLVTMNRPEVLNAMNMQMGHETHDLLTRLHHDPDWVRCVVLTGAGRAFSAGGDLKVRNTQSIRDWTIQHEIGERSFELRIESPVPWIAAVNGICYAGGLEAALTCDFIYADREARFVQTGCRIGIMAVRWGHGGGTGAGRRTAGGRLRAAVGAPGQEIDPFRPAGRSAHRLPAGARGVLSPARHRRPARRHCRVQRKAQGRLQRPLSC